MTTSEYEGRTPEAGAVQGFRRVAVGIDFSPSSLRALEVARSRFPGAEVLLLHVVQASAASAVAGSTPMAAFDPALLESLERSDAERLRGLLRLGESYQQAVGEPVAALLEAVNEWDADLLVVGTHARGALEYFFLGSTAEKLVARSHVPVLTVRLP